MINEQELLLRSINFNKLSKNKNIIVEANAGSGKTHFSYSFVKKCKDKKGIAITFTNKATDEIRNRIGKDKINVSVSTIHSFLIKLFREIGDRRTVEPKSLLYYKVLDGYSLDRVVFLENIEKELIKKIKLIVNLKSMKSLDYIIIDECQDLTKEQYELFKLINLYLPKIMFVVVGDPKQNIYKYDGDIFNLFEKDFNGVKKVFKNNYRSCNNLVDFTNKVFSKQIEGYVDSSPKSKVKRKDITIKTLKTTEELKSLDFSKLTIIYKDRTYMTKKIKDLFKDLGLDFEIVKTNSFNSCYEYASLYNLSIEEFNEIKEKPLNELKLENKRKKKNFYNGYEVKGLEFDNVLLIGYKQTLKTHRDIELNYVGVTRAKKNLYIF